jgi:hypothetical protein
MGLRDGSCVGGPGAANFDQDGTHGIIRASGSVRFKTVFNDQLTVWIFCTAL